MSNSIKTGIPTEQYIKPQAAKGKLVSSVPTPKTVVKDASYNMKALKDGFTGKANDHQLGKLNDIGMKVGGVALATYIATQKTTPKTKLMEFVGLATFFGAMKLWPKLAISAPAKAIHGFDPNQEYEDSFGRKKPFFQDAQYTPWDMYSNEKLQKIGDKMGVDKNAQDRNDLTKAKMQKVATQNNTLWMLTAGIASAVFSALACNKAEKVIDPALDKVNNNKADNMLKDFDKAARKYETTDVEKNINKIYTANKGKAVDTKLVNEIADTIAKGLDPVTAKGITEDVKNILVNGNSVVSEDFAEKVISNSKKLLEQKLDKEDVAKILPSKEQLVEQFKKSDVMGKELDADGKMDLRGSIATTILKNAKAQDMDTDDLKIIKKGVSLATDKAFESNTASKLDETAMKKLTAIAKTMDKFNAKARALDEYAQIKVADKPETVIANYWNNTTSSVLKAMNIDFKEMEKVRNNRELVQGMMRDKIEEITSDDAKYTKTIGEIAKAISELDKKIKPEDTQKYIREVEKTYDTAAGDLYKLGMESTADKLTALAVGGKGSLKRVKTSYYQERIDGVRNSFSRLINTLDTYRRISKGQLPQGGSREINEALVELVKQTTLQGHSSDHSIKFYFNRSQNPNPDTSAVEVKDGKVVNKYFDKTKGVDIPSDYNFYQKAMNYMYNSPMDKATVDALKSAGIENDVNNYNSNVFNKIGSADYFTKPDHKTTGDHCASSEYKFLLLGVAPDEMFTKTVQQTYNSEKWGKTFGTAGAVLTGLTVASQFLFGKGKAVK